MANTTIEIQGIRIRAVDNGDGTFSLATSGSGGGGGGGNVTGGPFAVGNVVTGNGGSAVQDSGTALSALAPLASPALTGTPTAPTAATGDNSTTLATTAFVKNQGYQVTINFAEEEVPAGTINGSNTSFTLAHTPNPAASLHLFKNGQRRVKGGVDYTLSGNTITYNTAPATGDTHVCDYRF